MVNKCAAFCCLIGNNFQRKDEDAAKLSTFYFLKNKPDLLSMGKIRQSTRLEAKQLFRSVQRAFHRRRDYKRI